jgi:putative transposase
MARMARLVVPGVPHHVTQRGARRLETFLEPGDYAAYKTLLMECCAKAGTEVWAWCLMPSHVHLILVPAHADGLRAALGETHRRYTRRVNQREGWHGHLWRERFHSFPMDEAHLLACALYVELNPVRAGLVRRARDWAWSSARAHLTGQDDGLVEMGALLDRVPDWRAFLKGGLDDEALDRMRRHGRSGHALGSEEFLGHVNAALGRDVRPGKPGRRWPKRDGG